MSSESLTSVLSVCYSKIFHWLRRPLLPTEASTVKTLPRRLRGIARVWASLSAFSDTPQWAHARLQQPASFQETRVENKRHICRLDASSIKAPSVYCHPSMSWRLSPVISLINGLILAPFSLTITLKLSKLHTDTFCSVIECLFTISTTCTFKTGTPLFCPTRVLI